MKTFLAAENVAEHSLVRFHVTKSSVAADMGDCLATIDMGRNRHGPESGGGAAVPLSMGESRIPI